MSIPSDTSGFTAVLVRVAVYRLNRRCPRYLTLLLRAMVAMAVVSNAWEETYKLLQEPLSLVSSPMASPILVVIPARELKHVSWCGWPLSSGPCNLTYCNGPHLREKSQDTVAMRDMRKVA